MRTILILTILSLAFSVQAKILVPGVDFNEKYSFKDFAGQDLSDRLDMTGTIVGSCFFQYDAPDSEVLPSDCNATFIRCNLDNVAMPKGASVVGGTNKRIKIINDVAWIVDKDLNPTESMDYDNPMKDWIETEKRIVEIDGKEWVVDKNDTKLKEIKEAVVIR